MPSLFLRSVKLQLTPQTLQMSPPSRPCQSLPERTGFPTHRALLGLTPGKALLPRKLTAPLISVPHSLPSPGALSCSRLSPTTAPHPSLPDPSQHEQTPQCLGCFAEHPFMVLPLKLTTCAIFARSLLSARLTYVLSLGAISQRICFCVCPTHQTKDFSRSCPGHQSGL